MSSEKFCNDKFPENGEIRCRKDKGHGGNHEAVAEVVDKNKPTWEKVRWEWDGKRIIEQPKP